MRKMAVKAMATVVIFLAISWSLTAVASTKPDSSSPKTIVVAVDLTVSAKEFKGQYAEWIGKIIDRLNEGDAFVLTKIMDASQGGGGTPINEVVSLPGAKPGKNKSRLFQEAAAAKREEELTVKRDQLKKSVSAFLKSQASNAKRTEIFGAISAAERIIRQYDQKKAVLVLFSDMVEDSSVVNFEKVRLNPEISRQIIEKEKSRKAFPQLKGVEVYVIAPSTQSDRRYTEIRNFWMEYFHEAGASLQDYNYANALSAFNE